MGTSANCCLITFHELRVVASLARCVSEERLSNNLHGFSFILCINNLVSFRNSYSSRHTTSKTLVIKIFNLVALRANLPMSIVNNFGKTIFRTFAVIRSTKNPNASSLRTSRLLRRIFFRGYLRKRLRIFSVFLNEVFMH